MQCGIDATFEQRQRVASKMVAEDFANAIIRRTTCKLCGEYDESKITVIKDGSSERCAHQWKVLIGDMVEADTDKFTAYGKQYKFMEIRQQVMLTCEICGMISRQDMYSTLSLYKEVPVR
jgi:RNase P subunit RPR2